MLDDDWVHFFSLKIYIYQTGEVSPRGYLSRYRHRRVPLYSTKSTEDGRRWQRRTVKIRLTIQRRQGQLIKEMVSDSERVDEEIIEEREIISDIERVDEEIIEEREIIPGYPCVRCS